MIETYLIGIVGIVALMLAWAGIQQVWRKAFAEHVTDEDALAERTRCTNCGCTTVCEKSRQTSLNGSTAKVEIEQE